jgi:DNA-binding response OmpR family regulator
MKVLLIEDDTFFQEFYAHKLSEQQITVEVASDGEEGLQKLMNFSPNIVLLDLIMPKKDGFEVLQEMGRLQLIEKIPVLVFSTLSQKADVERVKSLGASDVVNKSFFDFEKLLAKIYQLAKSE